MCQANNRKCTSCRNCPLRGDARNATTGMPSGLEVVPDQRVVERPDVDVCDPAVLQKLRELGAL